MRRFEQAPLLKPAWVNPGAFYCHVGGWEDEYKVAKQNDKIDCDDWETTYFNAVDWVKLDAASTA